MSELVNGILGTYTLTRCIKLCKGRYNTNIARIANSRGAPPVAGRVPNKSQPAVELPHNSIVDKNIVPKGTTHTAVDIRCNSSQKLAPVPTGSIVGAYK